VVIFPSPRRILIKHHWPRRVYYYTAHGRTGNIIFFFHQKFEHARPRTLRCWPRLGRFTNHTRACISHQQWNIFKLCFLLWIIVLGIIINILKVSAYLRPFIDFKLLRYFLLLKERYELLQFFKWEPLLFTSNCLVDHIFENFVVPNSKLERIKI